MQKSFFQSGSKFSDENPLLKIYFFNYKSVKQSYQSYQLNSRLVFSISLRIFITLCNFFLSLIKDIICEKSFLLISLVRIKILYNVNNVKFDLYGIFKWDSYLRFLLRLLKD